MRRILKKFNIENLLIKEYQNWYLLLRNDQVTLGSMVLIEKSFKENISEINEESFLELKLIFTQIESVLKSNFNYEKINYLMLMLEDKEVHFHIIPRYSKNIHWNDVDFKDYSWPKPIDLSMLNDSNLKQKIALKAFLKREILKQ